MGRKGGVQVRLAGAHVTVGLPLHAGFQDAFDIPEVVQPVVLDGGRVIEFPGVGDAVGVEGEGEGGGEEIAFFLGVDGRLGGPVGVVEMFVRPVVVIIYRPFQA